MVAETGRMIAHARPRDKTRRTRPDGDGLEEDERAAGPEHAGGFAERRGGIPSQAFMPPDHEAADGGFARPRRMPEPFAKEGARMISFSVPRLRTIVLAREKASRPRDGTAARPPPPARGARAVARPAALARNPLAEVPADHQRDRAGENQKDDDVDGVHGGRVRGLKLKG